MAKLKGKAKAAFLRRMKAGRKKAAGLKNKITRRKSSKTSGPKRSKTSNPKRKSQGLKRKSSSRNSSMAKKRRSSKKSRFAIPSFAKKAAMGIGLASIATVIVANFAPQAAPIVRPIAAFAGGGVVGVIADVLLSGGGFLGNIFGFGGNGQGQMTESV